MQIKKAIKWTAIVVSLPIVLFLSVVVALYLPPVQDWAVKKASAYASEQFQMDISIERLRLKFPIDIESENILVTKRSATDGVDTIASIGSVAAGIRMLPLFVGNVVVDKFDIIDSNFFTANLVDAVRVKGQLRQLTLSSKGISLMESLACIDDVTIKDGYIAVALPDSVPPDTTKTEPSAWKIAVGKIDVDNVGIRFSMNSDTLVAGMLLDKASVADVEANLLDSSYRVGKTSVILSSLTYDNGQPIAVPIMEQSASAAFDVNHLRFSRFSAGADSIAYAEPSVMLALSSCAFREQQSGLELVSANGLLRMDSSRIEVPMLAIKTATSGISATFNADLSAFDSIPRGKFVATVKGEISPDDITSALSATTGQATPRWPRAPMTVGIEAEGNMAAVYINNVEVSLPGAFVVSATGRANNLSDTDNLQAHIKVNASTQDMGFVSSWLDPSVASMIRIPSGIVADATVEADGTAYLLDTEISQGGGTLKASGSIDLKKEAYSLSATANALRLKSYMPSLPVDLFTGDIDAKGQGFDFLSSRSRMTAHATVDGISYENRLISGINLDANLADGKTFANLDSSDSVAHGRISMDGLLSPRKIVATMTADIKQLDLYSLGFSEKPLAIGLCGYMDLDTDMQSHRVEASLSDISIIDSASVFRPRDVELSLLTNPDTTVANLSTGDFLLKAEMQGGYEVLAKSCSDLMDEMSRQIEEKYIDYPMLRDKFPVARIDVSGGNDNMVSHMLAYYGVGVEAIDANIESSPTGGLNGMAEIKSMETSGVMIDYARLKLDSSDESINYNLQVKNSKEDNPYLFNLLVDGNMAGNQATCKTRIYDKADSLGLSLALKAMMEDDGIGLKISDLDPMIGYKTFHANDDNRLFLAADGRVAANVKLIASDGTGVMLYSDDDNAEALQDLTLSLHRIDMGAIASAIPYAPNVEGMFSGDFHAIQTADNISLSTDFSIDSLVYENSPMGDIGADLVYMPLSDGSHHVDGTFTAGDIEVASIDGNYNMNTSRLDAKMQLDGFPLQYANGFVPDQIVGLRGFGAGELSLKGHVDSLDVNGELVFDDASLYSTPYGVDMRFDETPVTVKNSRIVLDDFALYAKDNSPLQLTGTLDFSNLAAMMLNVTMRAKNFKVIDAKENSRSETFGKAFVDFFATAKGRLEALQIKGLLNVLGSTDMTYILRDSPLTTDNQLDELVKFTDFTDTLQTVVVARPAIEGLSMDLTINIDESARILCALNAAKTNYVDLVGSGDLRMQYTQGDIRLTGKYTLNNGEMKYSLPIIPLKTFTIQDGSSVEFTGDPFNPKLDITATEQVKASVSSDDGTSRSVTFTTGVVISKTLADMGLEFTIDAPEDLTLHNELQTMSIENRGKIAVTMLTTGMYLADGNTNSFSMNSALSAFLNSQINNISSGALRSLDMSFDMTGSTGATGQQHTDYSFKFAKRFWNNRLKIIVGGKLSSGEEVENQNETFFDNVTFEYRLSNTANKYLNLFYKRDSYDWLEGYITEFGAGFLWKRKMQRLGDLFRFKSRSMPADNAAQTVAPADTTQSPVVIRP